MIPALWTLAGILIGRGLFALVNRLPVLATTPEGRENREVLRVTLHTLKKLQGYEPTRVEKQAGGPYTADVDSDVEAKRTAIAAGLQVIEGSKHTLLLDLDDGQAINPEILGELEAHFGDFTVETWPSKSGKGTHAVLTFPQVNFSHVEAIALEMALGSDPRRGAVNIVRCRKGMRNPRMLFKPRPGAQAT